MASFLASLFGPTPDPPVAMVFTTGDAHIRLMPKFSAIMSTIMSAPTSSDYTIELTIVEDGSEADLNLTYKEFLAASVDMDHIKRKRRIKTNGPGECATMLRVCLEVGLFCASRGRECDRVVVFSKNKYLHTELNDIQRVCGVKVVNPDVMDHHDQMLRENPVVVPPLAPLAMEEGLDVVPAAENAEIQVELPAPPAMDATAPLAVVNETIHATPAAPPAMGVAATLTAE